MSFRMTALSTLIITSMFANAESYQFEAGGLYTKTEANFLDKFNTIGIGGDYYLAPVTTQKGPLEERAFLQNASYVGLTYFESDIDSDFFDFSSEIKSYQADFSYYVPNTIIYLAGNLQRAKTSTNYPNRDGFQTESENTHFTDANADIGAAPIDGLLVFTRFNDDYKYNPNIHSKYVKELGGGAAIKVELGFEKGDDADETEDNKEISATYYVTPALGFGASLRHYDDEVGHGIHASYFVTESLAFSGMYETADELDHYGMAMSFRF